MGRSGPRIGVQSRAPNATDLALLGAQGDPVGSATAAVEVVDTAGAPAVVRTLRLSPGD